MDWYGAVLAGGKSTRMGVDKAELLWRGERFIDIARKRLDRAVGRVLISGEGRGSAAISDLRPGLGPLGGIQALCARLPDGAALLVSPVDMPLLEASDLIALRDALASSSALAAHFEGLPLPLALRVGARARAISAALLDSAAGERSLRAFLDELGAVRVPRGPLGAERFLNFNDPAELERGRSAHETHV